MNILGGLWPLMRYCVRGIDV